MREYLEPIEVEVEKYTEDDYRDMLNECYGPIKIGYLTFDPAEVLYQLDEIAYNCGFSDYQEYETKYECPICGELFNDFDEAKWHCQEEVKEEGDV